MGTTGTASEEKTCDWCRETYRREDVAKGQTRKHWAARRFCGDTCRAAAFSEWNRQHRGEASFSWKGDDAKPQAGRKRARQMYGPPQPCGGCIAEGVEQRGRSELHHMDGNTRNNEPSNVAWLCRRHHFAAEDRMAHRRGKPGRKYGARDPERLAEVRRLRDAGWPQAAIADHFGLQQSTISALLSRHG